MDPQWNLIRVLGKGINIDVRPLKFLVSFCKNYLFFRAGKIMLQEKDLFKKVNLYNDYMENNSAPRLKLTSREVNGRLVLEGVLRIFWGLHHSIRVKEEHDVRPIMRRKSSKGTG